MYLTQEQAHDIQNLKMGWAMTSSREDDSWAQVMVAKDVLIVVHGDNDSIISVKHLKDGEIVEMTEQDHDSYIVVYSR